MGGGSGHGALGWGWAWPRPVSFGVGRGGHALRQATVASAVKDPLGGVVAVVGVVREAVPFGLGGGRASQSWPGCSVGGAVVELLHLHVCRAPAPHSEGAPSVCHRSRQGSGLRPGSDLQPHSPAPRPHLCLQRRLLGSSIPEAACFGRGTRGIRQSGPGGGGQAGGAGAWQEAAEPV